MNIVTLLTSGESHMTFCVASLECPTQGIVSLSLNVLTCMTVHVLTVCIMCTSMCTRNVDLNTVLLRNKAPPENFAYM